MIRIEPEHPSSAEPPYVFEARWGLDGLLYYLFETVESKPAVWGAYDPATRSTISATLPITPVPRQLGEPDCVPIYLGPTAGWGCGSPSRQKVIYQISTGPCLSSSARTVIWGAEISEQRWIKFQTFGYCGMIGRVAWLGDEEKAIVQFGGDGPPGLYVLDFQKGNLTPLAELSDFDGSTELGWALSPVKPYLAVINWRNLRLLSLEERKSTVIEEVASQPTWSADGNLLYFGTGPSPNSLGGDIRAYDMTKKTVAVIVSRSDMELVLSDLKDKAENQVLDLYPMAPFAVSPDGRWIATWGGWLRLIELRTER